MTLLNPLALLFGLVIGVLLLLHFQRRAKRIYRVANPELWRAGGEVKDTRPILKRIEKSWLLLLQILFLAAVVLALARPAIRLWTSQARTVVLVMDCSASMAAHERGGTRFDLARAQAVALLDQLGRNDHVVIVQARPQPVLTSYKGSETNTLRSALNSISPTQAPVDLYAAVVLGLSVALQGEPCEVLVFSDGTRGAHLPETLPAGRIHYMSFGETDNNVAITRLAVRNQPYSAYDHEAYAEIANFSNRPQAFGFRITFENQELLTEPVSLAPAQRKSFVVQPPAGKEGVLRASIDVRDDLDADNQAYAVLSPARISVLLVTGGNIFLEKALQVNPQITCRVLKPGACSPEELAKSYDVRILDGYVPADPPPGNYWIIRSSAAASGGRASLVRGILNLVFTRSAHPIAAYVDLGNVVIDEGYPVTVPPGGIGLIVGNDQTLLAVSESGAGKAVESGFDLRASNLPLTLSFPVLVSNIVHWLSGISDDAGNQAASGAPIQLRLMDPQTGNWADITTPQGTAVAANTAGGMLTFAGTETTGIYTIRDGGEVRRVAVNLFDASESDIKPVAARENEMNLPAGSLVLERSGLEIWRILLCASIALLVLEWIHFNRKNKGKMLRTS
jgi:Ca-activated chloride channel family protein